MQIDHPDADYCREMLTKVSRTFAPTIRMLPKRLCLTVTVAYLLCRIADTVEDEACIQTAEKEELLLTYADILKRGEVLGRVSRTPSKNCPSMKSIAVAKTMITQNPAKAQV